MVLYWNLWVGGRGRNFTVYQLLESAQWYIEKRAHFLRSPPKCYSDLIRRNQTISNQNWPIPTKSHIDRIRSSLTESDQVRPNPTKNQTEFDQVRPNLTEADQIRANPSKSKKIRQNPAVGFGRGSFWEGTKLIPRNSFQRLFEFCSKI